MTGELKAEWGFPKGTQAEMLPEITEGERSIYARSKWLPGPWNAEKVDKITWVDPWTGIDCLMLRGPMGNWCGYAGVPAGHPLHGVEYSGCVNRHPPKTYGEKLAEAEKWLAEAEEAERVAKEKGEEHHSTVALARSGVERLKEKDSWWAKHDEWSCTSYSEEPRCQSPEDMLEAHGGITYAGACQGQICHHIEGRPEVWWFGFDCAHSGDLVPGMLASSKFMSSLDSTPKNLFREHLTYDPVTGVNHRSGFPDVYRRVPYVKAEVEGLAKRLKELA